MTIIDDSPINRYNPTRRDLNKYILKYIKYKIHICMY